MFHTRIHRHDRLRVPIKGHLFHICLSMLSSIDANMNNQVNIDERIFYFWKTFLMLQCAWNNNMFTCLFICLSVCLFVPLFQSIIILKSNYFSDG